MVAEPGSEIEIHPRAERIDRAVAGEPGAVQGPKVPRYVTAAALPAI